MKNVLKYAFTGLLSLMVSLTYAQDTALLDRLYDDFSSKLITLKFSYVIEMATSDMTGEGTVSFQDSQYRLSANGLEVYCDGKDIWMVDSNAKEVIVEPVTEDASAFMQNPAMLFTGLKDNFEVVKVSEGGHVREPGVKDVVFTLRPTVECGIEECAIQIRKNGDLYYGTFIMSDDQVDIVRVLVNSITRSEKRSMEYFRPDQSFDSSWIVTDLR